MMFDMVGQKDGRWQTGIGGLRIEGRDDGDGIGRELWGQMAEGFYSLRLSRLPAARTAFWLVSRPKSTKF